MTSSPLEPYVPPPAAAVAPPATVAARAGPVVAAVSAAAEDLAAFLADLRAWYVSLEALALPVGAAPDSSSGLARAAHDTLSGSLRLAIAALRDAVDTDVGWRSRPAQAVVFGPTQTGKSTIVNIVVGADVAGVSPLAGFTVHAEAFVSGAEAPGWVERVFPSYARVPRHELKRDVLDAFTVTTVPARLQVGPARPFVVWDTPDFDSLRSAAYSDTVLRCVALADVPVVVLSREKYSDQTVWSLLRLVEPLLPALIVCLNKTRVDSRDELVAALRERLAEQLPRFAAAPIVEIGEFAAGRSAAGETRATEQLCSAITGVGLDRAAALPRAARFCAAHWDAWLAGPRAESLAVQRWNDAVDDTLESTLLRYRHEYVDHPQRFDALRRATAELLTLLEIPGIGPAMSRIRQIVSWPLRKVMAAGAAALGQDARSRRDESAEVAALSELTRAAVDHLHAHALRAAAAEASPRVWRLMAQRLDARRTALLDQAQQAARAEHVAMQGEIQQSAGELYDALRARPAVLAALRTARVTTDAAGVALSIKLGGVHVSDLIFAPALFAVTSMLAEGALGGHMSRVAARLRGNHAQRVRAALIDGELAAGLRIGATEQAELLGLDPQRMDQAQRCLQGVLDERG
ncbi:MAG: hypothetical protein CHACPFDD_01224 [Phycisphaerae bacterium]|nr:hypothetical protein [Phycisphaerae bacterium]